MAGGLGPKSNPKQKHFAKSVSSSEVLNNFQPSDLPSIKSETGVLTPGQSVEFNKEVPEKKPWSQEFISNDLETDQKLIIQRQGKEKQSLIEGIKLEIEKIIINSDDPKSHQEVMKAVAVNIPENNQYQLGFFDGIKRRLTTQDISNSGIWLETFNQKKGKQTSFWGKARNKKSGGQKYLFSGEHSASRSAN
jgi:uncharacterized protein DUF5660